MPARLLAAGKLIKGSDRWQVATRTNRAGWTLNDPAQSPNARLWLTDVPDARITFLQDSGKIFKNNS